MGQSNGKSGLKRTAYLDDTTIDLLVANTHFNRDQIVLLHQAFLNDCPNGLLGKKEFVKMFKQLHTNERKKAKADKYCEFVFKAFDADASGFIDFSEFAIAYSVTSSGLTEEKVRMAFKIFDLDRNGKLDRKEILAVIESLYDLNGIPDVQRKGENAAKARVDQIFKKLDENGDQYLSIDEFVNGCLSDEAVRKFLIEPLYNEA